jgi:hypothetical protein
MMAGVAELGVAACATDWPPASSGQPWEAIFLDVARPGRPALRVEVAGCGLLVLRQNSRVALMARVDGDRFGVQYVVTGQFQSPVAPIRPARAASVGAGIPAVGRQARWAHHFAAALITSTQGPLHTGRWVMSAGASHLRPTTRAATVAERWEHLLLPDGAGYIDWFIDNGAWRVLPLRRLADPGTGRVKAYRKQAREGILAPVLLWWISGLDCYVLLDGHDRLVAAAAEGVEPAVLSLSSINIEQAAQETDAALSRYARTAEALEHQVIGGSQGAADALAAVNRQLAGTLKTIDTAYGPSRAWPLHGGTARWNALATAHSTNWGADTATAGEPPGDMQ